MDRTPLDRLALVLVIIGALNWLSIGLAQYNFVEAIFGGSAFYTSSSTLSRIIYALVGLGGLYGISLLFRQHAPARD